VYVEKLRHFLMSNESCGTKDIVDGIAVQWVYRLECHHLSFKMVVVLKNLCAPRK
jgi:hypothetical protein